MRMLLLLVPILLLLGISFIAEIGSAGASDSCGGCDTSPGWADAGLVAGEILLLLWLIWALILLLRSFTNSSAKPS